MPDIVSPIDGEVAYRYSELTFDAALEKIERAREAQRAWAKSTFEQRTALCLGMLEAYRRDLDEHALAITRMMGKPLADARGEFERGTVERCKHLCDLAPAALADLVLPEKPGFQRYVRRIPLGVVLDIAAWNYPLLIVINVAAAAVLSGNAVLIKHAHQTALVAEQFERAFLAAGAPPGLVQAFPMDHGTAAALIAARRFDGLSFTGSVRGGHEVARTVAQTNFIPTTFELGGKDPALVLPDADVDFTVENLVDGTFYNAGQSCCGIERIYVHRDLYPRFVEAFVETTRAYRLGDPRTPGVTLGPLASAEGRRRVQNQIDAAVAKGARALLSDADFDVPDLSPCYMAPHVLVDVDHSMTFMQEETFGPAVGIMPFDTIERAVALANDSRYGLTASIWSRDLIRASRLAEELEAGTVYLNRCDYLDPGLAWTGVKDSGVGCSLSELGFAQFTRPKSHHFRVLS